MMMKHSILFQTNLLQSNLHITWIKMNIMNLLNDMFTYQFEHKHEMIKLRVNYLYHTGESSEVFHLLANQKLNVLLDEEYQPCYSTQNLSNFFKFMPSAKNSASVEQFSVKIFFLGLTMITKPKAFYMTFAT